MGYETRLIIGQDYKMSLPTDPGIYISNIATIDLSGSVFHDTFVDESDKEFPAFYCNPQSDDKITHDCYGSRLYAIDPKKVLAIMKKENKKEKYRRYNAAIPLLENIIHDFSTENIKCILFGH